MVVTVVRASTDTRNMNSQPLSPRAAWVVGVFCVLASLPANLVGFGVWTPANADPDVPGWVLACAGLMFVAAGIAIVLDYGIAGGIAPDGDLVPGTPMAIRVATLVLGMTIVGLLIAVCGWVAFGSGHRAFSTTISVPFLPAPIRRFTEGEASGRFIFGISTVLLVLMFVACAGVGIARLRRAWHQQGIT